MAWGWIIKFKHMSTLQTSPFVKWAGGKRQLLPKLIAKMPTQYGRYFEPFVGGGALLLALNPKQAVINDINEQLINVYCQLKQNPDEVIQKIQEMDAQTCNKDLYLEVRKQYNDKIIKHELDATCAALTIWVNKHCFNGLYRVNSKGLFNVPFNNKTDIVSMNEHNLRNIATYLNDYDVTIMQGDFAPACSEAQAGDFVYFDSPYVPASLTANFTDYTKDGFSFEEHYRLAELFKTLDKKGVKLMLSNHNVQVVYELYQGFNIEPVAVKRAINRDASKREGKEVIITNY